MVTHKSFMSLLDTAIRRAGGFKEYLVTADGYYPGRQLTLIEAADERAAVVQYVKEHMTEEHALGLPCNVLILEKQDPPYDDTSNLRRYLVEFEESEESEIKVDADAYQRKCQQCGMWTTGKFNGEPRCLRCTADIESAPEEDKRSTAFRIEVEQLDESKFWRATALFYKPPEFWLTEAKMFNEGPTPHAAVLGLMLLLQTHQLVYGKIDPGYQHPIEDEDEESAE